MSTASASTTLLAGCSVWPRTIPSASTDGTPRMCLLIQSAMWRRFHAGRWTTTQTTTSLLLCCCVKNCFWLVLHPAHRPGTEATRPPIPPTCPAPSRGSPPHVKCAYITPNWRSRLGPRCVSCTYAQCVSSLSKRRSASRRPSLCTKRHSSLHRIPSCGCNGCIVSSCWSSPPMRGYCTISAYRPFPNGSRTTRC